MALNEIMRLQEEIDRIDDSLIELLKRRFCRSRKIGAIKRQTAQPPLDPLRIQGQREQFAVRSQAAGLDAELSRNLYSVIIDQVILERLSEPPVENGDD
jgi:chorismate mutase